MKQLLKYSLIFLFSLSMAGCGFINQALDNDVDEGIREVDNNEFDADDRNNRELREDGVKIESDQERPQGLG